MGSDMVRTTMEPCTAHCFIACEPVGAKNFALDSGWTTSGTPQKHVDNKIGRILPVQKFGQLGRIGHWTMATAHNFYGFTLSNAPVPKVGPPTGVQAKSQKPTQLIMQVQKS